MTTTAKPLVAILMGSKTDLDTMSVAADILDEFEIPFTMRALSAHRTPEHVHELAQTAEEKGIEVIIAGAGGAAHLAGVVAANTLLPVIGVPMPSRALNGLDSLLSTVQMPKGIPVATMGIGSSGAGNAALFAVAIMARKTPELAKKLKEWRAEQARKVVEQSVLR